MVFKDGNWAWTGLHGLFGPLVWQVAHPRRNRFGRAASESRFAERIVYRQVYRRRRSPSIFCRMMSKQARSTNCRTCVSRLPPPLGQPAVELVDPVQDHWDEVLLASLAVTGYLNNTFHTQGDLVHLFALIQALVSIFKQFLDLHAFDYPSIATQETAVTGAMPEAPP